MWVLLSSRIRTWVLLAIAVPAVRQAVRFAARRLENRRRNHKAAKALRTADSALARVDRRAKRRSRTTDDR